MSGWALLGLAGLLGAVGSLLMSVNRDWSDALAVPVFVVGGACLVAAIYGAAS